MSYSVEIRTSHLHHFDAYKQTKSQNVLRCFAFYCLKCLPGYILDRKKITQKHSHVRTCRAPEVITPVPSGNEQDVSSSRNDTSYILAAISSLNRDAIVNPTMCVDRSHYVVFHFVAVLSSISFYYVRSPFTFSYRWFVVSRLLRTCSAIIELTKCVICFTFTS